MLESTIQIKQPKRRYFTFTLPFLTHEMTHKHKKEKLSLGKCYYIYLEEASDDKFLLMNVVLKFGYGACWRAELLTVSPAAHRKRRNNFTLKCLVDNVFFFLYLHDKVNMLYTSVSLLKIYKTSMSAYTAI